MAFLSFECFVLKMLFAANLNNLVCRDCIELTPLLGIETATAKEEWLRFIFQISFDARGGCMDIHNKNEQQPNQPHT